MTDAQFALQPPRIRRRSAVRVRAAENGARNLDFFYNDAAH